MHKLYICEGHKYRILLSTRLIMEKYILDVDDIVLVGLRCLTFDIIQSPQMYT